MNRLEEQTYMLNFPEQYRHITKYVEATYSPVWDCTYHLDANASLTPVGIACRQMGGEGG